VSDPTSFPVAVVAETIMRTIELGVTITDAAVDGASSLSLPPFRYMSRTPAGWGHAQGAARDRHVRPGVLRPGGRPGRSATPIALQVAMRPKALADPMRVKIMSLLFSSRTGEETSGDLATVLDLAESTVSQHLGQLPKAGLVISDRRGMNVFHRVKPEALQALYVWCLIRAAARDRTGGLDSQHVPSVCDRRRTSADSRGARPHHALIHAYRADDPENNPATVLPSVWRRAASYAVAHAGTFFQHGQDPTAVGVVAESACSDGVATKPGG
jgi:DNA-binding transcriptional ArsR family regulator